MKLFDRLTLACLIVVTANTAQAINVEVEFLGDTFFSQNSEATAAIEAAAQHVSDAITSTLTEIDQVSFEATVGNTTATLDWDFTFRDRFTNEPIGNLPTEVSIPFLAADTVKVFIDAQPLDGISVGQGVPSGASASINASILGGGPLNGGAIQAVAGVADDEMNRSDGGALIGQLFEGVDNLGGVDVNAIRFRSSFGGVAFDVDTNNDDQNDSTQQLLDFWHVDHNTPVAANKIDLFSVAVNEIATAIGFGTSDSFETQANGTDWLGSEVIELLGSGESVLDPSLPTRILSGTQSISITDGSVQDVSLDGNITTGVREELTALDLAFLRDIGFDTIVPQIGQDGDFDLDTDVDGSDFLLLQRDPGVGTLADWTGNYGAGTASAGIVASQVPEPTTLALTALMVLGAGVRARSLSTNG